MKFALQRLPNGQTQMVDANGNPLGQGDADRPILHILPKLWVPAEILGHPNERFDDGLMCEEITLKMTSMWTPYRDAMTAVLPDATLAQLRNTLLPKLISGDLRVPEAIQRIEEVAA